MTKIDPHHEAAFNHLVETMVNFAVEMIAEHGVFHPFGACILPDGQTAHLDFTEIEEPGDAIAAMADAVDEMESDIAVLLVDVRVTPPGTTTKSDSIMLIAETRRGFVMNAFLPYRCEGEEVTYGERFFGPEPSRILFPATA